MTRSLPAAPAPCLPPRSPGRPRGGGDELRQRILAAAVAAFEEKGFDHASLRGIAAGAGCDVSTIAHHFGAKLDLWKAAVDEVARQMTERSREIESRLHDQQTSVETRLRLALERIFDYTVENRQITLWLLREQVSPGDRLSYVEDRIFRPTFESFRPLWEEASRCGLFGPMHPLVAQVSIVGAITHLIFAQPSIAHLAGEDFTLAHLREAFCTGLLAGRVGQGEPSAG